MAGIRTVGKLFLLANMFCVFGSNLLAQDKSTPDSNKGKVETALTYFSNAADYQNSGAFELAVEEWEKLVKEFPDHEQTSTAWHHLGVCSLQRKEPNYARAIEAFTQALKDEKLELREESLINLSWALFTEARQQEAGSEKQKVGLERARASLVDFLKNYSDGAYLDQALFYLGDIEHLQGDRRKAISYFKKLLDTNSLEKSNLRPDALYALAVAYDEEQQYAEANRRYQEFLTQYPSHRLVNEVRLRVAEILLRDSKFAEAEEVLTKIPTGPKDTLADFALLRLGYAYAQQGKQDLAVAQYDKLIKQFPESQHAGPATLAGAQALYQAGNLDEAASKFRSVVELDSSISADAAHWLAITLSRQGKTQEIITLLEPLLPKYKDNPNTLSLQMDYADALYLIPDRLAEARKAYEQIADTHPEDPLAPRATYNAAFGALQAGDVAEAQKWAERFLGRFPQDPLRADVASVAAEALLQQGEHDGAIAAFLKLVETNPKNESVGLWNLRLGTAYYLSGKYDKATELLLPLIDTFPVDAQKAEAHFIAGASYLYQEKPEMAIKHLNLSHQVSDSWPSADEVLLLLGEAHERNKDNSSARKTYELLLKKYPNTRLKAQVEYKLAQLAAATGDLPDAIRRYRQIVADESATTFHNFAIYGVAWSLMQQDQYAEALKELQPLLKQDLQDSIGSEAKLAQGVCLRKLGKNAEAVESLQVFLQRQPQGTSLANGLYELGLTHTDLGETEEANKYFKRILEEVPSYPAMDKVLYEFAWNLFDKDQVDASTEKFAQLSRNFPESEFAAEANYMLAQQQYETKKYQEAVQSYSAILRETKDPGLLEKTRYKLGWSYFQLEQYDQAAIQFEQQASTYPTGRLSVDALFMNAECAFKKELFDRAYEGYERARKTLEADAGTTSASSQVKTLIYLHGGQSLRELKRWAECESWLATVIERFPNSPYLPTALYELGYCKQNQDKTAEALTHYAEVASNYRNEIAARARFMMGEVYFSQRDFVKAIPEFQRVMYGFGGEKAPEDIKNWQAKSAFEAARCSEVLIENLKGASRKKVVDTAVEFYEFVVQKHAKHELAAQAQTRLGELQKLR